MGCSPRIHAFAALGVAIAACGACSVYDRDTFRALIDGRGGADGRDAPALDAVGDAIADTNDPWDAADVSVDAADAPDTIAPNDATDAPTTSDVVDVVMPGTCSTDPDCDDRNACTGVERCVAGRCMAGTPPTCTAASPCDVGRCGGPANACFTTPIDADGDGVPARMVGGTLCAGTDCDDTDRTINPMATEVCDGVDNNCNGLIDEVGTCATTGDRCISPIRLTMSASSSSMGVAGTTVGATADGRSPCFGMAADVWYSVTYPAAMELQIDLPGSRLPAGADPVLSVRRTCDSADFEACHRNVSPTDRSARVWVRPEASSISTRTILVGVSTGAAVSFVMNLSLSAAVAGSCSSPFALTSGGMALGQLSTGRGSYTAPCDTARSDGVEQVYAIVAPSPGGSVNFRSNALTATYYHGGTCSGTAGWCDSAVMSSHSPLVGASYFLFVDAPLSFTGLRPYTVEYVRP